MTKTIQGQVTKASDKTITVAVQNSKRHPLYRKNFIVNRSYQVHDEQGKAKVGDVVTFADCPPVSKTKRWKLVDIVEESQL